MKLPKPNKYGAQKVRDATGKVVADSKVERAYYTDHLKYLEMAGEIKDVTKWPTVQLLKYVKFKPDYSYIEVSTGKKVFTDVKGVETGRFKLIVNIWKEFGP